MIVMHFVVHFDDISVIMLKSLGGVMYHVGGVPASSSYPQDNYY